MTPSRTRALPADAFGYSLKRATTVPANRRLIIISSEVHVVVPS
jgi:hypothetical protein